MLSFDITDRSIRIIRGSESNGNISIRSAVTIELEEEVIVNGHVQDVSRLAMIINGVLKENKMPDKEAIVAISSNLTIFKELQIPKAKESEFSKMVKSEMQSAIGNDENYSTSYIIVNDGSLEDEKGGKGKKKKEEDTSSGEKVTVLATACPYEVVENYKKVFSILSISLKSIMIGCNCITKVLLSGDKNISAKMPLLAVQIDKSFISLNIYENNQLSFSRFTSIDPADYDDPDDYVFQAASENIFRMLQFQKNRNINSQITNVVIYGDTTEYERLSEALSSQMDIITDMIKVPNHVKGYQNIEFSLYANAVGALYQRSDKEKVNLLESDTVNNSKLKSDESFKLMLLGAICAPAAVVAVITIILASVNASINSKVDKITAEINSQQTIDSLAKFDARTLALQNVNNYATMIQNANDAYNTRPSFQQEVLDDLDATLAAAADEAGVKDALYPSYEYADGVISVSISATLPDDKAPNFPALLIQKLEESGKYCEGIQYTGYTISEETQGEEGKEKTIRKVSFALTVSLKPVEIQIDESDIPTDSTDDQTSQTEEQTQE